MLRLINPLIITKLTAKKKYGSSTIEKCKMKFAKKNMKPKNDDNLLPLVNIIFLLLIFMIAELVQNKKNCMS